MKTFTVLWLALALFGQTDAQDEKFSLQGKHELSPSLTFQYMKDKDFEGDWYLSIPVRWTYFVTDKIGLGAELFATFIPESDPGVIFSGVFEYNIPSQKAFPFFTVGTGISNGSFLLDRIAMNTNTTALAVITLGSGIKIPLSNRLLLRVDVQYRNFRGKETYTDYYDNSETSYKVRTSYFTTAFGMSILL